jgi:hypothetical protein
VRSWVDQARDVRFADGLLHHREAEQPVVVAVGDRLLVAGDVGAALAVARGDPDPVQAVELRRGVHELAERVLGRVHGVISGGQGG